MDKAFTLICVIATLNACASSPSIEPPHISKNSDEVITQAALGSATEVVFDETTYSQKSNTGWDPKQRKPNGVWPNIIFNEDQPVEIQP